MNGRGISLVRELASSLGVSGWVVGGCLRDLLLAREVNDIDIALAGGWRELPRSFAERAGGSFFWLDEARGHSRVIAGGGEGCLTVDFAPLRGDDIGADLALRDFTINALALPLAGEPALLDPLHGLDDIHRRTVRSCSPSTFSDDPLRLVRAFRFAAVLGFRIEETTLAAISPHAPLLANVAGERIRDELFHILRAQGAGVWLQGMAETGLLPGLLAHPPGPGRTGLIPGAVARVERIGDDPGALPGGHAPLAEARLIIEVQPGVTVLSLMKLAAFLEERGGSPAAACERLRLGKTARRLLEIYGGLDAPAFRALEGPSRVGLYRFYGDREPAGPELPLLAHALGLIDESRCLELVDYWARGYIPRGSELLLSGDDVMDLLRIPPGKAVGEALELLREAQATGLVRSRDEAAAYLGKKQLTPTSP